MCCVFPKKKEKKRGNVAFQHKKTNGKYFEKVTDLNIYIELSAIELFFVWFTTRELW